MITLSCVEISNRISQKRVIVEAIVVNLTTNKSAPKPPVSVSVQKSPISKSSPLSPTSKSSPRPSNNLSLPSPPKSWLLPLVPKRKRFSNGASDVVIGVEGVSMMMLLKISVDVPTVLLIVGVVSVEAVAMLLALLDVASGVKIVWLLLLLPVGE